MVDDLIDDEVRRSFPGWSDEKILRFYERAKAVEIQRTKIFDSDLSHARIIRELGWDAFKEYLCVATGGCDLDDDDYIALTQACAFVREIDNTPLYAAIYGAAAEPTNRKTVSARKKTLKNLTSHDVDIIKGI